MAHRQPSPPALHAHTGDTGCRNFSAENLYPTANDGLAHSANYAEANFSSFAAPHFPESETSMITHWPIFEHSKELEAVKQREETRRDLYVPRMTVSIAWK